MDTTPLVDWAPLARLLLLAASIALLPLAWLWLRRRGADTSARLAALTALTLFLTFDPVSYTHLCAFQQARVLLLQRVHPGAGRKQAVAGGVRGRPQAAEGRDDDHPVLYLSLIHI